GPPIDQPAPGSHDQPAGAAIAPAPATSLLAPPDERPIWLPRGIFAVRPEALLDGPETAIRAALEAARGELLLVPDLHLYFGGSGVTGMAEAGMLLRRALVTGDPGLIATTTPTALARFVEADPALAERLTIIRVEPATVDEAAAML